MLRSFGTIVRLSRDEAGIRSVRRSSGVVEQCGQRHGAETATATGEHFTPRHRRWPKTSTMTHGADPRRLLLIPQHELFMVE